MPDSGDLCDGKLSAGPCNLNLPKFRLDNLPCGGCKVCEKAHLDWDPFLDAVDDVVPLASGSFKGGSKNSTIVVHPGNDEGVHLSAAAVSVVTPAMSSSTPIISCILFCACLISLSIKSI